jgi:hypothetical protein
VSVYYCPDCGGDDMMGEVDHGINCPRYRGAFRYESDEPGEIDAWASENGYQIFGDYVVEKVEPVPGAFCEIVWGEKVET